MPKEQGKGGLSKASKPNQHETSRRATSTKTRHHDASSSATPTSHKQGATFITRIAPKFDGGSTTSTRTKAEITTKDKTITHHETPTHTTGRATGNGKTTTQPDRPNDSKPTKNVSPAEASTSKSKSEQTKTSKDGSKHSHTAHLPNAMGTKLTKSNHSTATRTQATSTTSTSLTTSSASSGSDSGAALSHNLDGVGPIVKAVGITGGVFVVLVIVLFVWCRVCRPRRKAKARARDQQRAFCSPRKAPTPPRVAQSQMRYGSQPLRQDQPAHGGFLEKVFDDKNGDIIMKIKSVFGVPHGRILAGANPRLVNDHDILSPVSYGTRLHSANPTIPRIPEESTQAGPGQSYYDNQRSQYSYKPTSTAPTSTLGRKPVPPPVPTRETNPYGLRGLPNARQPAAGDFRF